MSARGMMGEDAFPRVRACGAKIMRFALKLALTLDEDFERRPNPDNTAFELGKLVAETVLAHTSFEVGYDGPVAMGLAFGIGGRIAQLDPGEHEQAFEVLQQEIMNGYSDAIRSLSPEAGQA